MVVIRGPGLQESGATWRVEWGSGPSWRWVAVTALVCFGGCAIFDTLYFVRVFDIFGICVSQMAW